MWRGEIHGAFFDGGLSGSVTPVITGDFGSFGTAFPWGPVDPAGRATAYGDRDSSSGQSGTPWGIGRLDAPDGRFRVDGGLRPDPEFGDRGAAPWSWCTSRGSS